MKDYLIRVITTNKEIRALALCSTKLVELARQSHSTTPVATAALGRALSGALLIASMIKSGEEVGLVIEGDGPLKKIVVEANQKGIVRGYTANPHVDFKLNNRGKLDVASAIGKGTLKVIKHKLLKEPYESTVSLVTSEIGDDLSYYFTQSEQTPSAVGLGVLVDKNISVKAAGGFIIQLLPDAQESTIEKLERNLKEINSVSKLIEEGKSPEDLMQILLTGFEFRVMARKDIYYKCKCDRKRIETLLLSLNKDEIDTILKEQRRVKIKCHFCNRTYNFNEKEINKLMIRRKV